MHPFPFRKMHKYKRGVGSLDNQSERRITNCSPYRNNILLHFARREYVKKINTCISDRKINENINQAKENIANLKSNI